MLGRVTVPLLCKVKPASGRCQPHLWQSPSSSTAAIGRSVCLLHLTVSSGPSGHTNVTLAFRARPVEWTPMDSFLLIGLCVHWLKLWSLFLTLCFSAFVDKEKSEHMLRIESKYKWGYGSRRKLLTICRWKFKLGWGCEDYWMLESELNCTICWRLKKIPGNLYFFYFIGIYTRQVLTQLLLAFQPSNRWIRWSFSHLFYHSCIALALAHTLQLLLMLVRDL